MKCNDPSLKIVACAITRNNTLFFNKKVIVHYPKGNCTTPEMRKLHRGFLLALNKAKIVNKCQKCWTKRTWNNALGTKKKLQMLTMDQMLKEIEKIY